MIVQTRWDVGNKINSPDGEIEAVIGVRVTNKQGVMQEFYLLEEAFGWYSLEELLEVNDGK